MLYGLFGGFRFLGTVGTPLSSIKNGFNAKRVAQVLLILSFYYQSDLGDKCVRKPFGFVWLQRNHRKMRPSDFKL